MAETVETFDIAAYAREQGWDPGAVCALTDKGAQSAIAVFMVCAVDHAEHGEIDDAKASVDLAIRALTIEREAGRTKQAERAAREATEG
jgi:hypothetical protein